MMIALPPGQDLDVSRQYWGDALVVYGRAGSPRGLRERTDEGLEALPRHVWTNEDIVCSAEFWENRNPLGAKLPPLPGSKPAVLYREDLTDVPATDKKGRRRKRELPWHFEDESVRATAQLRIPPPKRVRCRLCGELGVVGDHVCGSTRDVARLGPLILPADRKRELKQRAWSGTCLACGGDMERMLPLGGLWSADVSGDKCRDCGRINWRR